MKARISSQLGRFKATVTGTQIVAEHDKLDRFEVFLTELKAETGIKEIQLGESKQDEIYLVLTFADNSTGTIAFNSEQARLCGNDRQVINYSREE